LTLTKKEPTKNDPSAELVKANKAAEDAMKTNVALEAKLKARDVKDAITTATNEGVAPAFFGEWKDDPVKWLNERFGGSITALQTTIDALPRQSFGAVGIGSGGTPEPEGEMEYGKVKSTGPIAELHKSAMSLAAKKEIPYHEALAELRLVEPDKYRLAMVNYNKTTGSAQ
jgi:hypothetical protein